MRPSWINDLKVGDKVITIEIGHSVLGVKPGLDGMCVLENVSIVTKIESNYIETEFVRGFNPAWENLERAYKKNVVKNYFAPDGSINIKPFE